MLDTAQHARDYLLKNPNATFKGARQYAESQSMEKRQVVAFARAVARLRCDERRVVAR
jgi:hypothetical protein